MTDIPGNLDTSQKALALCLSARKLLSWVPLARGGQVWGRELGLSKAPYLSLEAYGWAAAGGNSWCLSLEPNGCVCLNPSSSEPPRRQVG